MNDQPEILDFVKAVTDVERLRVIGALTRGPASAAQVASALDIPFRDAFNCLEFLAYVNIVEAKPAPRKQDQVYELKATDLENLSRDQFRERGERYIPAPNLDEKTRKVLASHLNADGSIKHIPRQETKQRVILEYLAAAFTPETNYAEKEVNAILQRFHADFAGLRRALIDSGLMQRESDGSRYWRTQ